MIIIILTVIYTCTMRIMSIYYNPIIIIFNVLQATIYSKTYREGKRVFLGEELSMI